jgi:8-oxo-dGTP pyrophosphatase MutT (NUDIX family)
MADQSSLTPETVRAALKLPLPGRPAQLTMAVRPRPGDRAEIPESCPNVGAVLVLVYPVDGRLVIPLIVRTERVELHKGQVSLPGGAREAGDRSLVDTALREAGEEVGVPRADVEVLGPLSPLYIPVSSFCVYPYVGFTPHSFQFRADPREVARVVEAPLDHLLNPATQQLELHERDGQTFEVPFYRVSGQKVWGATAMILAEFVALLRSVVNQQPP